jgi:hypothetical protein
MEWIKILLLVAIAAVAFAVNIPLGKLRSRHPKLSLKWMLYIHVSIPVIYGLRSFAGIGLWAVPFLIAAAVAGQVIGGKPA